jgi:ribosomal protein S24E
MDLEFPRYERDDARRRIDVEFVAHFSGAIPSRESVRSELALVSGADPAAIALDRLSPRAKMGEVRGKGRIYDDLAAMKAGER